MKKILLSIMLLSVLFLGGCNFLPDLETEVIDIDYINFLEISTVEELKSIEMNQSYQLIQDIDLNGEEWVPLGTLNTPYLGHFKGNGFTISNFVITENNNGFNGLFGYVKGDIENLNITGFNISIEDDFVINAGGLAGMSLGSVNNVSVSGNISVSANGFNVYVGLLVGNQHKLAQETIVLNEFKPNQVYNNVATGHITVTQSELAYVGGLLGKSHNTQTYNNEVIDVLISVDANQSAYVGGLIGQQFLYGFTNENPSLSINYKLVYENIVDVEFDFDNADGLKLGGLIGYSQNSDIVDNFITLGFSILSGDYQVGMVIGDLWLRKVENNLVILRSMDIVDQTEGIVSSVIGRYQEINIEDLSGFYASEIVPDFEDNIGINKSMTEVESNDFYQINYPDLPETFITRIKEILF